MNSIINNCAGTKLLELRIWFQTVFEKGTIVAVQVGSRAPLIHNDYEPLVKIYFYDITSKTSLPTLGVTYNSLKIPLELSRYQQSKINRIDKDEVVLHFTYNLSDSTKSLPQKYYSIKQQQDKYARGRGLQNLIRGESQFLSLFERNDEIQQIKAAEQQQQRMQKDISLEIIKIKRQRTDYKVIFVIIVFFVCFGVLFHRIENNQFLFFQTNHKSRRKFQKKRQTKKGKDRAKPVRSNNK